jgi:hypothetical protein
MSVAERLHLLSELEEKYAIELDREYRGYGNEVVRDLPTHGYVAVSFVGKDCGP